MLQNKPCCHKCVHRRPVPFDCHSRCNNTKAHVRGSHHGILNGWFFWPFNFDPVWLLSCTGFSDDPKDNLPDSTKDTDLFLEILKQFR